MCGRLSLHSLEAVYTLMDLLKLPADRVNLSGIEPRYNVAPTMHLPVLVERDQQLSLFPMLWGILPDWAIKRGSKSRVVNARSETACELPTFRESMQKRRCVVVANGFFEWQRDLNDKPLHAHYVQPAKQDWIAMAGMWQASPVDGTPECCVLTTAPNRVMAPIHDRMPCLLSVDAITAWLGASSAQAALPFLRSAPDDALIERKVSARVNAVRNDGPELLQADTEAPQQGHWIF